MTRRFSYRLPALVLASLMGLNATSWAFFSIRKETFSAGVTLGGGGTGAAQPLTITALPLSNTVQPGKHFVIPIQVTNTNGGTIDPTNLRIDLIYQVLDSNGNTLVAPTPVTVQSIQTDPKNTSRLLGTAYINRDDLAGVLQGGQIKYVFRALQGATGVYLGGGTAGTAAYPSASDPNAPSILAQAIANGYVANVSTSYQSPVYPSGSAVFAPDTYESDGLTGLRLDPGAVATAGTLQIDYLNLVRVPSGPGGSRPTVAYNYTLLGTQLLKPAQIVLSYPADLDGQIADRGGNPLNLAPYWWDGVQWRLLSRPQVDTTLHTVTGTLPPSTDTSSSRPVVPSVAAASSSLGADFQGSFALFPVTAGSANAASLRPAERIITPNGDGINDEAGFSGLLDTDEVHIFDIRGRRIRTLGPNAHCRTLSASRCWDGRNDDGGIVESGVYIYQFTSQGDRINGVIAVAK